MTIEYEETPTKKIPLPVVNPKDPEHSSLKNSRTGGVLYHIISNAKKDTYFQSDRFLIIAPSSAGKSVLASNIAIYITKRYNNILIIAPHKDDMALTGLAKWADEAGMNVLFTSVDKDGNLAIPDKVEKSIIIIDDYFSQQNQPLSLKKLISELFIRGRHDNNHVYYITHSTKNIPHEVKLSSNGVFINQPYLPEIPMSKDIPIDNDKHQFWMLDSYINPTKMQKLEFKPIAHINNVILKLKSKIYPSDKKIKGVLPGLDLKRVEILKGEEKAGNTSAKTSLKNSRNLNRSNSSSSSDDDDIRLPKYNTQKRGSALFD